MQRLKRKMNESLKGEVKTEPLLPRFADLVVI